MLGTKIFIFTRSRPFPTCFCLKRSHNGIFFFHFFSIFYYFLEFSITGRVGNDWNDNFYCHSFSTFPNLFWIERSDHSVFLFFAIFFQFAIGAQVGNDQNDNFCFHSFSAFPNLVPLGKKP